MKKTLLIFLVTLVLILSGCSFDRKNISSKPVEQIENLKNHQEETKNAQNQPQEETKNAQNQPQEETKNAQNQPLQVKTYQLKPLYPETTDYTKIYEQKLIKVNEETNKEEVVIHNIKETLPELKENNQLTLKEFAYPVDSKFIFFRSVIMETDNPAGNLYSFNTENNVFKKMNIDTGFFAGFALSPDNTRFALVPQSDGNGLDQILYICNLFKDNCEKRISLNENETFNKGYGDMSSSFEIKWINDFRIEYSVFDQHKKQNETNKTEDSIFIDSRYLDL